MFIHRNISVWRYVGNIAAEASLVLLSASAFLVGPPTDWPKWLQLAVFCVAITFAIMGTIGVVANLVLATEAAMQNDREPDAPTERRVA